MENSLSGLRVLHLVKTGSGARWAYRNMRELVRRGVEVHVAVPNGPLVAAYQDAGVIVHNVDVNANLSSPLLLHKRVAMLEDLVSDVKPDIVHSHFVGTTLTMRLALRSHQVPCVFQVPGPLHLEHGLTAWLDVATASKQDYWIGTCTWTCMRYQQLGVPSDRVFLCYYGREPGDFVVGATGALRSELNLGQNTHIIGMVAYMYPPKRYLGFRRGIKGHEDLIDALALCLKQRDDIVGVFVGGAARGGTAYERSVRVYAHRKLGSRAFFLGTRPHDDIPLLYPDFDVAVHPSLSENLGGATESLLACRPTIATAVGGLPDIVRDGDTGWLVPPHAPQQLAYAILDALANPVEAAKRANRGYELANQISNIETNVTRLLCIYETVLRRSKHE